MFHWQHNYRCYLTLLIFHGFDILEDYRPVTILKGLIYYLWERAREWGWGEGRTKGERKKESQADFC